MVLSEEVRAERAAVREQLWEAELEKRAGMNSTEKKAYMAERQEEKKAAATLKAEQKAARVAERERNAEKKVSERRRIDMKKAATAAKKEERKSAREVKAALEKVDEVLSEPESDSELEEGGGVESSDVVYTNVTMV
jgi:membrane protein involved in colicin uptake